MPTTIVGKNGRRMNGALWPQMADGFGEVYQIVKSVQHRDRPASVWLVFADDVEIEPIDSERVTYRLCPGLVRRTLDVKLYKKIAPQLGGPGGFVEKPVGIINDLKLANAVER